MADYSIELGVKLNTKDIDTQISSYNRSKNLIKIKADLDPSDITKVLNSYKAKPIDVDTKLNTDGITKKIRDYKPPKMIHLESELSTVGIDNKISGYVPKTPIRVDVELTKSSINEQIKNSNPSEQINIKAKLDDDAITEAINGYKNSKPIKIKIEPDFRELNFSKVEELLKGYEARTPLKVNVSLNKTEINRQISEYNQTAQTDAGRQVLLKVKIAESSVSKAITELNNGDKLKIPVDLTIKPNTEFDTKLKQRIDGYEKTPISIPAKLIPYDKGFSSQIQKVPVPIDVTLKNAAAINQEIKARVESPVQVPVKLVPAARGFDSKITSHPVPIHATLLPEEINSAITNFRPSSKIKVGVDLRTDDINAQIEKINPTSKVDIKLDLGDNINEEVKKQSNQTSINVNVKLDREDINKQIREFKTNSKIKVGVKLDFASHEGGQIGIPQQIKNYRTNTRINVGVKLQTNDINTQIEQIRPTSKIKLDKDDINNQIKDFGGSRVQIPMNLTLFGSGSNGRNSISQQVRNAIDQALRGMTTPVPIRVELEPSSVQSVQNQINNIRQQIAALGNITINFGGSPRNRSVGATTTASQRALREVYNLYKKIESMELKLGNLNMSGIDAGNIAQYRAQLDQLRITYQTLLATLTGQNGAVNLDLVFTDIDQAKTWVAELSSEIENLRTKSAQDIKIDIDNGNLQAKIDNIEQGFNKLGIESQQVTDQINELRRLLGNMDASDDVESITNDYREFSHILETVGNRIKSLQNVGEPLNLKKESARLTLESMFEDGSQAAKVFGERARHLANELNNCGKADIDNVIKKIKILGQEVKQSHLQTQTLKSKIKEQFSRYSSYFSVASVFMYAAQATRSMFEQVKLIDSAMTELKKVTDETDESYNQFLTNAATRAREIGITIDGLISSTADFARLGYGFGDAQGLAEVANIYAVVGDDVEGVEGATESLISTMAAFKDELNGLSNTDFAMSIIDKFNEIGNKFAISSGGIGEAMKRSASSLDAANNTIDESIALITAANTVVQNPDKVGNAFKTISMRIRGAKTE